MDQFVEYGRQFQKDKQNLDNKKLLELQCADPWHPLAKLKCESQP